MILVPLSTWKSQIVVYITTPSYFIHSKTVHLKIVHCHQEQVLFQHSLFFFKGNLHVITQTFQFKTSDHSIFNRLS